MLQIEGKNHCKTINWKFVTSQRFIKFHDPTTPKM